MTLTGTSVTIDFNFACYVEFQKAVELYMTLEDKLAAPFVSGTNGTSEEVPTREALLEKVLFLIGMPAEPISARYNPAPVPEPPIHPGANHLTALFSANVVPEIEPVAPLRSAPPPQ